MQSVQFLLFFNDTATTEIYTLSLHDALPISQQHLGGLTGADQQRAAAARGLQRQLTLAEGPRDKPQARSEEHTSELQSPDHLVFRLLLEKKNTPTYWSIVVVVSRACYRRPRH